MGTVRIQYGGNVARNAQHLSVMRFADRQREPVHGSSLSVGLAYMKRDGIRSNRHRALEGFYLLIPSRAPLGARLEG